MWKSSLVFAAHAAFSQALSSRDTGCCFKLTGDGGPGGPVGQLPDGQNRLGQSGLPEGVYCISSTGGLTDSNGRGCVVTQPETQWQCDTGATATPGFAVSSNGTLTYENDSTFYACPTGDNGGYNIYDQPLKGQQGCVPITLEADACHAQEPAPAPAPPPPSACPRDLPAKFEYPHLIIPIDSSKPNQCYGTQYNGSAFGTLSTIFNFDIPPETNGKTCSVEFLFPKQENLVTTAYEFSGDGIFKFAKLNGVAGKSTTFATSPKVEKDYGSFTMSPGNAYDIASFPCPGGQAIAFWLHATGNSVLEYFQDYNPCAIGLYVVAQ